MGGRPFAGDGSSRAETQPAWRRGWISLPFGFKLVLLLTSYVASSVWVYRHFEGWSEIDSIYFAIVALTTVGYGDLSPAHPFTRMWLCAQLIVELFIIVNSLSGLLDNMVAKEVDQLRGVTRLLLGAKKAEASGIIKSFQETRRRRCVGCVCLLIAWIIVSAIIGKAYVGLDTWGDALYFGIVTLTTMGFGDIAPKSGSAKLACSLLCLVGVPLFGGTLTMLAKLATRSARMNRLDNLSLTLTSQRLETMQEFCREMEALGVYSEEDDAEGGIDKISPFEYLCFVLMQNDVITIEDVAACMQSFKALDTSGDGFLEISDLEPEAQDAWRERSKDELHGN